jgi:hypothetical protein
MTALLAEVGKPNASVRMCTDPVVRGANQVLNPSIIEDVVITNPQVDLYILVVDRDGDDRDKSGQLRARETEAEQLLRETQHLLGSQAHQEVEVWLLAAQNDLPAAWTWTDVRSDPDAKEVYFEPYANQNGFDGGDNAMGREVLGRSVSGNYTRVRQLCGEVENLEGRVADVVA